MIQGHHHTPRGRRSGRDGEQEAPNGSDNDRAPSDGKRGSDPEREYVAEPRHTLNVCAPQQFKARVPKFSGKSSEFSRYKHELINFARVEAID